MKITDTKVQETLENAGWEFKQNRIVLHHDSEDKMCYSFKSPRMTRYASLNLEDNIIEREAESIASSFWHNHFNEIQTQVFEQIKNMCLENDRKIIFDDVKLNICV